MRRRRSRRSAGPGARSSSATRPWPSRGGTGTRSTWPRRGASGRGCRSCSRHGAGRVGSVDEGDERLLLDTKSRNLAARDAMADEHAARTGLDAKSLRAYLGESLKYELGDEEREGLERFYAEAARGAHSPARRAGALLRRRSPRGVAAAVARRVAGAGRRRRAAQRRRRGAPPRRRIAVRPRSRRRRRAPPQAPRRGRDVHRRPQRQLHQRLHHELPVLRLLSAGGAPRGVRALARGAHGQAARGEGRGRGSNPPSRWAQSRFAPHLVRGSLSLDQSDLRPRAPRVVAGGDHLPFAHGEAHDGAGAGAASTPRGSTRSPAAAPRSSSTGCGARSPRPSARARSGST